MTRPTPPPDRAARGGLSRRAFATAEGARRSHSDDLLDSLLGPRAEHFKDHPLDGESIISAIPRPDSADQFPAPENPPLASISADDNVGDMAEWFRHGGREGQKTSTPADAPTKVKSAPSIAAAATDAAMGLSLAGAMGSVEIDTGTPGDSVYVAALDKMPRPPSTFPG